MGGRSAVLVALALGGCGLAESGRGDPLLRDGESHPGTMVLEGTVRDFLESHIDMQYSKFGLDADYVESVLGADNKPVYRQDISSSRSTHGAESYNQWYRDVPGVNQPTSLPITLTKVSDDPPLYTYHNSSFFPIDDQLFGNEGSSHNYHFTFEIHSAFTYRGGEEFTFIGDDDVLVFVNKRKIIDIGGIHSQLTRSVKLDEVATDIGLIVGGTYQFDLFFAERHRVASNFKIETSIATFAECEDLAPSGAGIVGLDSIDVSGTPHLSGDYGSLFSNGPITLAGDFEVDGDVVSGADVTINGDGMPGGSIIEYAPLATVPDPTAAVEAAAENNDNDSIHCVTRGNSCDSPVSSDGQLKLASDDELTLATGTYYFPGGINVSGKAQIHVDGTVLIYVGGGTVTLNGGSSANPTLDSMTIISSSTEDAKLNGGGSAATRIYAPFATVRFSGTQGFIGSAVGKHVVASGTAELTLVSDEADSLATTCTPREVPDEEEGSTGTAGSGDSADSAGSGESGDSAGSGDSPDSGGSTGPDLPELPDQPH